MIDHNVMRLDIPMHYAFAVTEVQGLKQLVDVEPYIVVHESGIERSKVCVVDIFED